MALSIDTIDNLPTDKAGDIQVTRPPRRKEPPRRPTRNRTRLRTTRKGRPHPSITST